MAQLSPLTKLFLLFSLTLIVFTASEPVIAIVFILLAIFAITRRKTLMSDFLGISIINKRLIFLLPLSIAIFWLIYNDIYIGTLQGLVFLFRLGILMVSALIFVSTTSQYEMIDTLVRIGVPYELAFMLNIAIRFAPVLTKEFKEVMEAQKARAYKINLKNIHAIVIPTVILLIKRSYEISLAMYTRGFRQDKRPKMQPADFKIMDYFIIILAITASIVTIIV